MIPFRKVARERSVAFAFQEGVGLIILFEDDAQALGDGPVLVAERRGLAIHMRIRGVRGEVFVLDGECEPALMFAEQVHIGLATGDDIERIATNVVIEWADGRHLRADGAGA